MAQRAPAKLKRNIRRSPLHQQHVADGAYLIATERMGVPRVLRGPGKAPTVEWGFKRAAGLRAHHRRTLNLRENVGGIDMTSCRTSLCRVRTRGRFINRVCANDIDAEIGRVVYTQWLDDAAESSRTSL